MKVKTALLILYLILHLNVFSVETNFFNSETNREINKINGSIVTLQGKNLELGKSLESLKKDINNTTFELMDQSMILINHLDTLITFQINLKSKESLLEYYISNKLNSVKSSLISINNKIKFDLFYSKNKMAIDILTKFKDKIKELIEILNHF